MKRFTATGVEFVDGTAEDDIDVVVLATGYSFGFPFIDKEVYRDEIVCKAFMYEKSGVLCTVRLLEEPIITLSSNYTHIGLFGI